MRLAGFLGSDRAIIHITTFADSLYEGVRQLFERGTNDVSCHSYAWQNNNLCLLGTSHNNTLLLLVLVGQMN